MRALLRFLGRGWVLRPTGAVVALLAFGLLPTSPSFAACTGPVAGIEDCTGAGLAGGVPNPPGGTTTLNVHNLDANIVPAGGVAGISFVTQGANDEDPAHGGPNVTINFDGSVSITTSGANGIIGQSTAGTGEAGGLAENGVDGGLGGAVTIDNHGVVTTTGIAAIFANSVGGAGGNGGNSCCAVDGGVGGRGGAGNSATITNSGTILTHADNAVGLLAVSRGGNGGIGGSEAIGGDAGHGGGGGGAGIATINNTANITTEGSGSVGILARSLGGNGNKGGNGWLIIVGGGGGGGATGNGNAVNVTHDGVITTTGASNAVGIMAQSVGGFAGDAGDIGGLITFGADGNSGGVGGRVEVKAQSGSISTSGTTSYGVLAQSIGGGGGSGGTGIGLIGFGGNGGPGGAGGEVKVNNNTALTTTGNGSTGIVAQSIGGGGGSGGTGVGLAAIGGGGGGGGNAGPVTVGNTNIINVSGNGADFEFGNYGIFAQSVGGGGGSANASGGYIAIGGSGGPGGNSDVVTVTNSGNITSHCTNCRDAGAIYAQSVGGGGGRGGNSFGLFAIGGSGGGGGTSSSVSVTNSGALETHGIFSRGIFAQSIGGGGGDGGFAGGVFTGGGSGGEGGSVANPIRIGGKGGAERKDQFGAGVTVDNSGKITTTGDDSQGIFAQSVGGGGGNGGGAVSVGVFIAVAVGGTGGVGGDGGLVTVHNVANDPAFGPVVKTSGERSAGVFAQSVGGGGGSGGFAVAASGGIFGGFTAAFGGDGAKGGNGGKVFVTSNGEIQTQKSFSSGIYAESIGGGGGRGGIAVAAGVTGLGIQATLSFGGGGGAGGTAQDVSVDNASKITTGCNGCVSDESHGIFASSIGGGGGSGGASIAVAGGQYGAVSAGFGGNAGEGNGSGIVHVGNSGAITTFGRQSHGILAQSIGGGGGSGGFSGALALNLSGIGSAGLAFGGEGGKGGGGNTVTVDNHANITTWGQGSNGVLAQSIGGGGGNGGFAGAITFDVSGGGSMSNAVGGKAGEGSIGKDVTVKHDGAIETHGDNATGIFAQSVGGGGGNGGFSLSAAGSLNQNAKAQSVGGKGGAGGHSGVVMVGTNDNLVGGSIQTFGALSRGIQAQSIGGGGGNGGFSLGASFSLSGDAGAGSVGGAGGSGQHASQFFDFGSGPVEISSVEVHSAANIVTGAGCDVLGIGCLAGGSHGIFAQSVGGGGGSGGFSLTLGFSLDSDAKSSAIGGSGGGGGDGGIVVVDSRGNITTRGYNSHGIFAQSVGGGGGDGAFSIAGGASIRGDATTQSVGGSGGAAGRGSVVTVLSTGEISTVGALSHGILAQSVGGGGGSGGFAISGTFSLKGKAGGNSVGGSGNGGGDGGIVDVTSNGKITTRGENSYGILAQSVGGGGGNGAFSISGAVTIDKDSEAKSQSIGGSGGAAGNANMVTVHSTNDISTYGVLSHGILAQSVGGGGGAGGFSIGGTFNLSGKAESSSVGGSGAGGGNGGVVEVTSEGVIRTAAANSHGIFAQSVGGGGGSGAFSIAGAASIKDAAHSQSIGGEGGAGGDAEKVTVTVLNDIYTTGVMSHGVLAQSVGGGGGDGGFSLGAGFSLKSDASTSSVGGSGSGGGLAKKVTVNVGSATTPLLTPTIHTTKDGSIGVFAQSVGGGGGSGGFSGGLALSIKGKAENNVGGSDSEDEDGHPIAGVGGMGGEVHVSNWGTIKTEGNNAAGVLAQSVGGGGGNGGFSVAGSLGKSTGVANSVGGSGAGGGPSSTVQVDNYGLIQTGGNFSHGIMAQSIGGGGGNGGFSIALGVALSDDQGSASSNVGGGAGGGGGNGGDVIVNNTGTIIVDGANGFGVFAQSVGGGGGSGGIAGGLAINGKIDNAVGGDGGKGGNGGDVTVTSTGTITTSQNNSSAVFAQSVAGSGGWSGLAIGFGTGGGGDGQTDGLKLSVGSKSIKTCLSIDHFADCLPADGTKGKVTVTINGGTTVTEGSLSYGLLAQAIAGGGGAMGTALDGALNFFGSDVVVDVGSNGSISGNALLQQTTYANDASMHGLGSIGLISQSIGGGGGVNAFKADELDLNPIGNDSFLMRVGGYSQGGGFIGTGSGGGVSLTAKGTVTTTNHNAIGIVGQTIGGGGGISTVSVVTVVDHGKVLDMTVGGSQLTDSPFFGNAGPPSEVIAEKKVTTNGVLSHGIVAQSIGGGGGVADVVFLNGVVLTDGTKITIGSGAGGAGGNGGELTVTSHGVETTGAGAFGIVAQSIGGGGGLAGVYSGGKLLGQSGFSLTPITIAGGTDADGNGDAVTVNSYGDIHTNGFGAHGIVAQSIGGGGGIVGNGTFATTIGAFPGTTPFAGSVGGVGSASTVAVNQTRNVVVTGEKAVGIFGQSAGGTGADGNIDLKIEKDGTNGNGIGLIWASHGSGAAVQIADGANNTLKSNGTLYAQGSLAGFGLPLLNGMAILGGAGNDAITNLARTPIDPNDPQLVGGTRTSNIIGNIDLGGGINSLLNQAGALFITDGFAKLGNGLLTNSGFVSPGDRGRVKVTDVTGDFTETSSGAYYVDIDLNQQSTPNPVTDRINVTGNSSVGGEGPLLLLSINKAFSDAGYIIVHSDGVTTDTGFTPTLTPPAVGFIFKTTIEDVPHNLVLHADKPSFLSLLQNPASGTTDPNVFAMGTGIDSIENAISIDDPFNYLINLLRLQPSYKALGDAVVTLTPHQAPHLFEITERRSSDFLNKTTTCPMDWANPLDLNRRDCIWGDAAGGEYHRGIVLDSPTNEDKFRSFVVGGQGSASDHWNLGFGIGAGHAFSQQWREGINLSSLSGDIYQLSLLADYRDGPFGVAFIAAGLHSTWEAARNVKIDGFQQTYSSFDGVATGVPGVGELPAFSDKTIKFDGISGVAKSNPALMAFNPRIRFSHFSEFGGVQVTSSLDVDGHIMHTDERSETGVGLANLTYPAFTQTAVTFTPRIEVGFGKQLDTGSVFRGFVRGGVMLSPTNAWRALTQFTAAPAGLPPIEMVEHFDDARLEVEAGLMVSCPSLGMQLHLNYGGAFGATTNQHEVTGGVTFRDKNGPGAVQGSCY